MCVCVCVYVCNVKGRVEVLDSWVPYPSQLIVLLEGALIRSTKLVQTILGFYFLE